MKTLQLPTIDDFNELKKDILELLTKNTESTPKIKKYSKSSVVCNHFSISYGKLKKIRQLKLINAPRLGKEYLYSIEEITQKLESGELSFDE
jgi:predicted transcriptional regulator